jgi:hypothetical protein
VLLQKRCMNMQHTPLNASAQGWIDRVFSAKVAENGGVVRRSVASVEREIGRAQFEDEIRRRRFHLLECGGQYIVICISGRLQIIA